MSNCLTFKGSTDIRFYDSEIDLQALKADYEVRDKELIMGSPNGTWYWLIGNGGKLIFMDNSVTLILPQVETWRETKHYVNRICKFLKDGVSKRKVILAEDEGMEGDFYLTLNFKKNITLEK